MRVSLRRAGLVSTALVAVVAMAACGSSSKKSSSSSSNTTSGGSSTPNVSISSFTNDFSAMAQLKDLASQGKGKIAVLLPDTQSSARYVSFDAPYLKKAFETAGLSSS